MPHEIHCMPPARPCKAPVRFAVPPRAIATDPRSTPRAMTPPARGSRL